MLGPKAAEIPYCLPPPAPHCTEISPHGSTFPNPSFQYSSFPPPPPPQHFLKPLTHGLMLPPSFPFYYAVTSCYMPSNHYSSYCICPPPPPPGPAPHSPTSNPAPGNDPATKLAKLDIVNTNGGESVDNPGEYVCCKEAMTLENHTQPPPLPTPFYHRSLFQKRRLVWLPKSCTCNGRSSKGNEDWKHGSIVSRTTNFSMSLEFDASQPEAGDRTTVMIRNIPNKLSRDMLLKLLDKHCVEENEKAPSGGSPSSQYDFVYLPMDFRNKCNLGYAFVNFTTGEAACRLYRSLHHYKWNILQTKKISHICYARVQGKSALLHHFRNSYFECDTDEYLPAVLSPPRNGATSCPHPSPVGRRAASLRR